MKSISSIDRWQNLKVFLFYSFMVWLIWYFKFLQFGYYEDDYWYSVIPSNMSFMELLRELRGNLINFEGNMGRFVGYTVPFFLTHVMFQIGGLPTIYIFGIFLVAFNAYLFYVIFGRLSNWWFGFFAGLIFIVFPADTSKALIVHIYQLQLSLMFTLLAFYYYESKRILSYLLALTSLLTYENAFLGFIFIPFLRMNLFQFATLKKWFWHVSVLVLFVLAVFVIRKFTGEARVSEMGTETIRRIFLCFIYGPVVSLYSYFNAPFEAIQHFGTTWPMITGLFIILVLVFLYIKNSIQLNSFKLSKSGFIEEWNKFPQGYLYLCLVGLLMMSVGYLFAFTHFPPRDLVGRSTSVHLGATIGSVLFFISVWLFIFSIIQGKRLRMILVFILIGWISLMGSRGLLVQNDFVNSWEIQRKLYEQIFSLASDMDDEDLILLEDKNLVNTKYIDSYAWPLPGIPEYMIEFPEEFKTPPRIVFIQSDPGDFFSVHNSRVCFLPIYPFVYDYRDTVYINSNQLIYLKVIDHVMVRIDEDQYFEDHGIELKRKLDSNQLMEYSKTRVYKDIDWD